MTQTGENATNTIPGVAQTKNPLTRTMQSILQLLRKIPSILRWLWKYQRHWLILLLSFLPMAAYGIRMAWGIWTSFDSLLVIQPFVPILAFSMAWGRRADITFAYQEKIRLGEIQPNKSGQIGLALIGCLLLIAASVAIVPSLAIFSLVVVVVGIIYWGYGWSVVGLLWAPLTFLVLMTPPGTLLFHLSAPFQSGNAAALSVVLRPILHNVRAVGPMLLFSEEHLTITPSLSGLSVAIPILVLAFWLAFRRRVLYFNYPVIVLLSLVVALLVNFVRLLALALVIQNNAWLGDILIKINSWLLIIVAFLLVRALVNRFRPRVLSQLGEGRNTLQ